MVAEILAHESVEAIEDGPPLLSMKGLPMPFTLKLAVPFTDEALIKFSRQNRPYQIEQNAKGELEIMSPTGGDGSVWETIVSGEILLWAKSNGGKAFGATAGFKLPDGSIRMPDAAWVSDARWSALTKVQRQGLPPLCPEFVVEVLSISDSKRILEGKMDVWIANGTHLAWMIDPYGASLSIYRSGAAVEVLHRPDIVEAGDPVQGFRLSTFLLWDE